MCVTLFLIEMRKLLIIFLIIALGGAFSFFTSPVFAFESKENFPKIANYYLQPLIPWEHYDDLAKYDLLILDVDAQAEKINTDAQILAYLPSQSVNIQDLSSWARFRNIVYSQVNSQDWWLRDSSEKIVSLGGPWPTIKFVDPGKGWAEYLSNLVKNDIMSRDVWDGIFYDMVYDKIEWLNNGDIGVSNKYWQEHIQDLINRTRSKISPKVLVINLDKINSYESGLNGVMMENFPSSHLSNDWATLINYYLNELPLKTENPKIFIINANTNNSGQMTSYQEMRFGLTSTLLGDGYYSFDHGDQTHSQVWWYDEYNISLGKAQTHARNLLKPNNYTIKSGLWRRDFENGIVLVNSTNQKQDYIFSQEEFEKINGTQDRRVNNGARVNLISLEPNDGIVLLKTREEIKNSAFINGSFVRVFNQSGHQTQNGFFAFEDNLPGQVNVLVTDDQVITNGNGIISIYENNKKIKEFRPYDFEGNISLARGDLNGDGIDEIVVGPGFGGGPHVKVLNQNGQTLSGFMAYDENFRGGINLAVGDVNNDGTNEIITGTGLTGGPHVKVFNQNGQILSEFMAYDEKFRGGVNVAVGNNKIITGPGPTGGPHLKVFSSTGLTISEFMAYNENNQSGLKVMSDDIDNNGLDEILVGTINF